MIERSRRAAPFAILMLLLASCLGGEVERTEGLPCEFSVECAPALECHYDRCRQTCEVDDDCAGESVCIRGSDVGGARVCTLPVEQACEDNGCPELLSCGPDDGICREPCDVDGDCAGGRRCVNEVCVER